jgi:hypothetical protein
VWDYWLYLRSPDEALYKVLSEFNAEVPKLSPGQLKKFQDIIFMADEDDDEKRRKMLQANNSKKTPEKIREEIEHFEKDFHVEFARVALLLKQSQSEMLWWSLWLYRRECKDIKYIRGEEEMTQDRHKTTLDSKWLKKALKTS